MGKMHKENNTLLQLSIHEANCKLHEWRVQPLYYDAAINKKKNINNPKDQGIKSIMGFIHKKY